GFWLNISRSTISDSMQEIELTRNESRILFSLARNRGKILSRDQIINDLWDSELFVDDNTLTVNMTRLRAKLELLGKAQAIKTKRGQGYLLE
ncbi:MAG TPA: winged helix-turn-helix domain-containing protein, partial [Candidatus Blautia merdigallinarum]|nr:winged helix-turn-helix domain-containing protein [Candidatus Blautia merdigallinarum]